MMAKCPVCLRKVSLAEFIKQGGSPSYRCARCGRPWRFSRPTVALAAAISLIPIAFVATLLHQGVVNDTARVLAALAISCLLYLFFLLTFGTLGPVRENRAGRNGEERIRR